MTMLKLSSLDKFQLIGMSIKAATGVIGASLILSETHPYFALGTLAIGAVANEVVMFLQKKALENKTDGEFKE